MTPEQIKALEDNLTIAIEALEYYSEQSHCELHDINKARDALVKISANNIVTKYHNTLKNLKD